MCIAQFQLIAGPTETETPAQRAKRLQVEARASAAEHIGQLEAALMRVSEISGEIAEGGLAYPPGVQDLSGRLSGDAAWSAQTLVAILRHVENRRETVKAA